MLRLFVAICRHNDRVPVRRLSFLGWDDHASSNAAVQRGALRDIAPIRDQGAELRSPTAHSPTAENGSPSAGTSAGCRVRDWIKRLPVCQQLKTSFGFGRAKAHGL